jgi:hypothetical protein
MNRKWYQEDGVTSHSARESLATLRENFPERIISYGTDFPYPSHFADLTPPDAYLWGMLKDSAFTCEVLPRTVPALHKQTVSFCRSLPSSMAGSHILLILLSIHHYILKQLANGHIADVQLQID